MYKHRLLEGMPQINTVAIWIVFNRRNHLPNREDGMPDINTLNMLIFKIFLTCGKKKFG